MRLRIRSPSLAGGRCPNLAQRGIAELMEAAHLEFIRISPLSSVRGAESNPLLGTEGSYTRFSEHARPGCVRGIFVRSKEYWRDRYGMGEVLRMLRNIGSGAEPEMALRQSQEWTIRVRTRVASTSQGGRELIS